MTGKRRIGLISLHYKHNYGTMLQAFALQKKLRLWGYEAQYIDYRHPMPRLPLIKYLFHRWKRLPANLFHLPQMIVLRLFAGKLSSRRRYFDAFYHAYIKTGETRYDSEGELQANPPDYDIYLVGSDQVWNPNLSFYGGAYFLSFAGDGKIKAAYAPSIGVKTLDPHQAAEMAKYLRRFKALSCREQNGADLLSELYGKKVPQVVDPTFLLSDKIWSEVAVTPDFSEPYIFCYFLGEVKWHRDFVRNLEKQTGLKAYFLPNTSLDVKKKHPLFEAGPAEFVGLIQNATYVCTDSFHGCVFSIIFEKQLYGFCKRLEGEEGSDNSRLEDLFLRLGISQRLIKATPKNPLNVAPIDYAILHTRLMPEIQRSESYLRKILASAGEETKGDQ